MAVAVASSVREKLYINGAWTDSSSGGSFEVRNPATGDVVGSIADATLADAERAIQSAHAAFDGWSKLPAEKRSEALYRAYNILMAPDRVEQIARVLTQENGKPLAESRGEILAAGSYLLWSAEEAKRVYGRTVPASAPSKRVLVLRQPVGVVAAITPWNFPASMITRKLAPGLAAGCTVVMRPASQTPFTAVEFFKVFDEAGIPAGVANLITSKRSAEIGSMLVEHPLVRKITFTGSTEVGKQLLQQASKSVKRSSMELGGHAPFLVFEDADLDAAAQAVIASKFRNAGQTCICANRLYVQRSVSEIFGDKVAKLTASLKVGNGLSDGVQIGPLIDERSREKVEDQVQDAIAKGAKVLVGGKRLTEGELRDGFFYAPTVVSNATSDMKVCFEETFGPLLPIIPFDSEDEALALANDSPYGLAAYYFTRDLGRAFRVAEGLDYGIVGCNDPLPTGAQMPFGGMKESGMGRENGLESMDSYLETKTVSMGGI
jgi:succinate-semialdehyde dehydrogenase/glutarate-semialdehyde dehydrogenase